MDLTSTIDRLKLIMVRASKKSADSIVEVIAQLGEFERIPEIIRQDEGLKKMLLEGAEERLRELDGLSSDDQAIVTGFAEELHTMAQSCKPTPFILTC